MKAIQYINSLAAMMLYSVQFYIYTRLGCVYLWVRGIYCRRRCWQIVASATGSGSLLR